MIPERLWDGEVRCRSHEEAGRLVCQVMAAGSELERHSDGTTDSLYRTHVALVAHPSLTGGEVYALFWMGLGTPRVYRCHPDDAREAIQDFAAYNLT